MSYDLAVFDPLAAPRDRDAFMAWYFQKTDWREDHDYNNPSCLGPNLRGFFDQLRETFPPLNGPFKYEFADAADPGSKEITDYSLDHDFIYMCFRWSAARSANLRVRHVAYKHGVGFFDVSATNGEIVFPRQER